MAHHARTQPDGTWVNGYVPPNTDFRDLDQKTFQSLNGDGGGTWAPSSPIIIGGSGIDLEGPNHIVGADGVLFFDAGSKLWLSQGSDHVIDDAYVRYGAGHRARNLVETYSAAELYTGAPLSDASPSEVSISGVVIQRTAVVPYATYFRIPVRDGATLKQVTGRIVPATTHVGLPATFPKFRVFRFKLDNSTPQDLFSLGYAAWANGSLTSWNSDVVQTCVLATDQNKVIDKTQYYYAIQFVDEQSTNALAGTNIVNWTFLWDVPDLR